MLTIYKLELEGKIRQCNEGKWEFSFDESNKRGNVVLDIGVPKHLDSSLIDVDVHPNYVSVVIKSKVRHQKAFHVNTAMF
jgi:protein TilB